MASVPEGTGPDQLGSHTRLQFTRYVQPKPVGPAGRTPKCAAAPGRSASLISGDLGSRDPVDERERLGDDRERSQRSSRTRNPADTSAAITRGVSASPRSSARNCSAANSARSRQGPVRAWAGPIRTHFTITVRAAPAPRAAPARQARAQDAPSGRRRRVRGTDPSGGLAPRRGGRSPRKQASPQNIALARQR